MSQKKTQTAQPRRIIDNRQKLNTSNGNTHHKKCSKGEIILKLCVRA
jgi:hypothetical protein